MPCRVDLSKDNGNAMKHLVLGSRGQVGQYIVREAKERGHKVTEWDIVITPDHDLRYGSNKLVEAMQESDYVHFLASDVGGSKYLAAKQNSFDFIQNNILLMDNVFSALRMTGKPFYYTSSQMSIMSHSTYGKLKAVGESYANCLGGNVVWFWNVFGLETDPDKSHVITDFIRMGSEGKILCRTTGTEERQFVYGKDIAKVLFDIAESGDHYSEPIHLTSGTWHSIRDVASIIASKFSVRPQIFYSDKIDSVQGLKTPPSLVHTDKFGKYFRSLESGVSDLMQEMMLQ